MHASDPIKSAKKLLQVGAVHIRGNWPAPGWSLTMSNNLSLAQNHAFALARTTRGGGNRIAARERFAIKKVEPLGGKVNYDAHELAPRRTFCCARRSAVADGPARRPARDRAEVCREGLSSAE